MIARSGAKSKVPSTSQRFERFAVVALAPVAALALRILMATWRLAGPSDRQWRDIMAPERVMFVIFHGSLIHMLAFSHFPPAHGRKLVVLTGTGFAGLFLGGILDRFGLDHVHGMSGRRSIGGAVEFVRRIKDGDVGVIAVDGPAGPRCIAKPGVVTIAGHARAHMILASTTASTGVGLPSWDRTHLPAPFSRVAMSADLWPPPSTRDRGVELLRIERALTSASVEMRSPIVPREPVVPPELADS